MTNHTDTSRSGDLVAVMKDQLESWEFEDPRESWWKWQHQYAQAADCIEELDRHLTLSGKVSKALSERIEALEAENERLIKAGDGDAGLIHWQGERIQKLEAALREIARLRTDLRGDFSLGSKQSDIARAALGEKQ